MKDGKTYLGNLNNFLGLVGTVGSFVEELGYDIF
jgi:hypothetical protein